MCLEHYTLKTQPWPDQTKAFTHGEVWPFVMDVLDNLTNTTTQNSVLLHSLLLTLGNHFGHFRRHDTKIKRHNLEEIISKRAHSVPPPQTNTGTKWWSQSWGSIRQEPNTFYAFISPGAMGDMTTGQCGGSSNKEPPMPYCHWKQTERKDDWFLWEVWKVLSVYWGFSRYWNVVIFKERGNLHR